MSTDLRARTTVTMPSWRFLVSTILVVSTCAYVVPIERSIGLFTATQANPSVVSSGNLLAPVALLANATGPGTITLNWTQSASAFTTGYNVYRISGAEPDYTLVVFRAGLATTSFIDNGLAPATGYTYYVQAVCGDWTSAASPSAFAITP